MKNLKLSPTKLLKQLASRVAGLRGFLITILIIGLLGYVGYLFSRVINLQPDPAYLQQQRQAISQTKIHFDKSTIQAINSLQQVNPKVDLTNIGKSDPFAP